MCSLDDVDKPPEDARDEGTSVLDAESIELPAVGGTGDAERVGISEGAAADRFGLLSRSRSRCSR